MGTAGGAAAMLGSHRWDRARGPRPSASKHHGTGRTVSDTDVAASGPLGSASGRPRRRDLRAGRPGDQPGSVGGEQWLGVASVRPRVVPTAAASSAPVPSTTRASSRSWRAPCARSSPPWSAARASPCARAFQAWRCWSARSGPGSRPTPSSPRPSATTSSSGSTASPRSWRRPRPATPSLFSLLAEDAKVSDQAADLRRAMLERAGIEVEEEEPEAVEDVPAAHRPPGGPAVRAVPPAVQPVPGPRLHRRLAEPRPGPAARRLGAARSALPLLRVRWATAPRPACRCPSRATSMLPGALQLMLHQAQVVAAAADGHRTFLLADEPGLGKTAQALLAARGRRRVPAARRGPQRRQDQLGPRGQHLDARTARSP